MIGAKGVESAALEVSEEDGETDAAMGTATVGVPGCSDDGDGLKVGELGTCGNAAWLLSFDSPPVASDRAGCGAPLVSATGPADSFFWGSSGSVGLEEEDGPDDRFAGGSGEGHFAFAPS